MNIKFKSIDIYGFRSLNKVSVSLDNQGIVIVKGINEYEDKATSNGSGKSSVFEALIYAIFEETSSGEKDVENRILKDGYSIDLKFDIDNDHYRIFRQCKKDKSTVSFYKNEEDISARNKTDTNKLIQNTLNINKNIFLDSIFLSQNAVTNLASLSPTARKERLEILTNTDQIIEEFKEKIKERQNQYEANCVDCRSNIDKNNGKKESLNNQIQQLQYKIEEQKQEIERKKQLGDIKDIEQQIDKLNENIRNNEESISAVEESIVNVDNSIKDFNNKIEEYNNQYNELQTKILQKQSDISSLQFDLTKQDSEKQHIQQDIERIKQEIEKIKNSDTCPTCGRKYDNINEEHINQLIQEKNNLIKDNTIKIQQIEKVKDEINSKLYLENNVYEGLHLSAKEINSYITPIKEQIQIKEAEKTTTNMLKIQKNNEINEYRQKINNLQNIKEELLKIENNNIKEYEDLITQYNNDTKILDEEINKLNEEYNKNDSYVQVIKNILQLITKEFRTYLLKNSIAYLNKHLQEYSMQLFSNEKDVIKIEESDTKLNIYLGNATYESLSGGEKTRVNIALLLAQKSLANVIGNMTCNLIILDEILGYCDSEAESNVINLITNELDSLETIYMISHKEIPIGYDNILTIVKDKNGLSQVYSS